MKNYYRIMLGKQSIFAQEAYKGNFIGAGWLGDTDLTNKFPQNWREFNKKYIPIYQEKNPDKTKVSAGLACGMLWTISKGIQMGDIILCPNGQGSYYIGEVTGDYEYHKGQNLPHQRAIRWYTQTITREEMSEPLRNACGSIGTVSTITQYAQEIESFISGSRPASIISTDETIEDPSDTCPIDILAVSKDKTELLVVIIAFENDIKLQRALSVTTNIDFFTYKVSFKLERNK